MTYPEIAAFIKDLILSGAAITGAVVAIKGLGTWKQQLRGQSEYDLSRRILVTLFKYRDAINGVRHPAMFAYEMPSPPEDESKGKSSEQIHFHGLSKAYQARWNKVQTERTSLYADLLKGEAIWGNELNGIFKSLFNLEHELYTCVRHYLELINPDTEDATKKAITKIRNNRRDILYADFSNDGDEYKKEFQLRVEEIEKYLKPKLHY